MRMTRMIGLFVLAGVIAGIFVATRKPTVDPEPAASIVQTIEPFSIDPSSGSAQAGQKIFADACASCHGPTGMGGVGKSLIDSAFLANHSDAQFISLLLKGRPGTAMRGFRHQLTEQQLADVIAFVRTGRFTLPATAPATMPTTTPASMPATAPDNKK